jgi:predicted AAA+ superfamily ATPase
MIFIELLRRGCDIFYHKTSKGHEVDFIAQTRDKKALIIQVCTELNNQSRERECRPLPETAAMLGAGEAFIVTLCQEEEIRLDGINIHVLPAYKWLLGNAPAKQRKKIG